jgi:hypothetical protein
MHTPHLTVHFGEYSAQITIQKIKKILYIGLARTLFIRCMYGIFGREITQIYSHIRCIYTVLANPTHH